jgi:phage replication-related protein YjqB (UPF0714/DUF867 family)
MQAGLDLERRIFGNEMVDRFKSMSELLHAVPAHGNYEIQHDASMGTRVKLFAPHGGCIEPCTGALVREIALGRTDFYIFHGMRKKSCYGTLHVTAVNYDEERCNRMARSAEIAVAIHGCSGRASFIELGGGNRAAARQLLVHLARRDFPARLALGNRKGADNRNFINLSRRQGVQLELSAGFRRSLYADFPKTLQPNPVALRRFVQAVQDWILEVEATLV